MALLPAGDIKLVNIHKVGISLLRDNSEPLCVDLLLVQEQDGAWLPSYTHQTKTLQTNLKNL